MFESEQGDPLALHLLEVELSFRSVPRATKLLANVKRALGGNTVQPAAKQNVLFEHKPAVAVQVPLLKETPNLHPSPQPTMTVEDALKVLKVNSGAPWEAVEFSRRRAVDRARPDKLANLSADDRRSLKEGARRANVAYLVLLKTRTV